MKNTKSKAKSAYEVADEILVNLYGIPVEPWTPRERAIVVQALTAYAEQSNEGMSTGYTADNIQRLVSKARAEALEEAAHLFEGDHPMFNVGQQITFMEVSRRIRARKKKAVTTKIDWCWACKMYNGKWIIHSDDCTCSCHTQGRP